METIAILLVLFILIAFCLSSKGDTVLGCILLIILGLIQWILPLVALAWFISLFLR